MERPIPGPIPVRGLASRDFNYFSLRRHIASSESTLAKSVGLIGSGLAVRAAGSFLYRLSERDIDQSSNELLRNVSRVTGFLGTVLTGLGVVGSAMSLADLKQYKMGIKRL